MFALLFKFTCSNVLCFYLIMILIYTITLLTIISFLQGLSQKDYDEKKEFVANRIIERLENKLFPGLKSSISFKEVVRNC